MEKFGGSGGRRTGLGNALRAGAFGAAALLSLGKNGNAEASQLEIAQAKTNVALAQFDVDKEKTPKNERKLVLAKAKLDEAIAKDADDKEKSVRPAPKQEVGVASGNKAITEVTHKIVDIVDDKGHKIGTAEEGSKAWYKLEKKRIEANRPVVVIDNSNEPTNFNNGNNSGWTRGN